VFFLRRGPKNRMVGARKSHFDNVWYLALLHFFGECTCFPVLSRRPPTPFVSSFPEGGAYGEIPCPLFGREFRPFSPFASPLRVRDPKLLDLHGVVYALVFPTHFLPLCSPVVLSAWHPFALSSKNVTPMGYRTVCILAHSHTPTSNREACAAFSPLQGKFLCFTNPITRPTRCWLPSAELRELSPPQPAP